jgi:hypothetical protein
MQEQWKPVVGYEGLYEVSNFGRVKSLQRNGTVKNGKILNGANNGKGYLKILLCNNKKVTKYIHIIVAEAFLDYKVNKGIIVVDHIDNNKSNNNLNNLRVLSHRENITRGNRSNTNTPNIYKIRNKYRLIVDGKHIGYYSSLDEAITERNFKLKNIKNG